MFENFYTTKMSPEKKSIEDRFEKISGKDKRLSKKVIFVISAAILLCALSVSVVFATIDRDESQIIKVESETEFSEVKPIVENTTEISDVASEAQPIVALIYTNPVEGEINIVNKYSESVHPVTGEVISHKGIDIEAEEGKEVFAAITGTVKEAEYDTSYGNHILIEDDNGNGILYAHLSQMLVSTGDEVTVGQTVGLVGKTGIATGPHLHFEMKMNGEHINLERVIAFDNTEANK